MRGHSAELHCRLSSALIFYSPAEVFDSVGHFLAHKSLHGHLDYQRSGDPCRYSKLLSTVSLERCGTSQPLLLDALRAALLAVVPLGNKDVFGVRTSKIVSLVLDLSAVIVTA